MFAASGSTPESTGDTAEPPFDQEALGRASNGRGDPRVGVVVVAAGQSSRMGGTDKIFAPLMGLPLIAHSLDQFESCPEASAVVLVLGGDNLERGRRLVRDRAYRKVFHVCEGGKRRQDSVRRGLDALPPCDWVIVHDGARPCLDQSILRRGLVAVQETGAAVAGVPVKDTIKVVSLEGRVQATPSRDSLWAAQTPQLFRYSLLREAHDRCTQAMTDDAAMVEILGYPVKMFLGSYENLKVTTPDDMDIAEAILRSRLQRSPISGQPPSHQGRGKADD